MHFSDLFFYTYVYYTTMYRDSGALKRAVLWLVSGPSYLLWWPWKGPIVMILKRADCGRCYWRRHSSHVSLGSMEVYRTGPQRKSSWSAGSVSGPGTPNVTWCYGSRRRLPLTVDALRLGPHSCRLGTALGAPRNSGRGLRLCGLGCSSWPSCEVEARVVTVPGRKVTSKWRQ